jgi:hypothetical protein
LQRRIFLAGMAAVCAAGPALAQDDVLQTAFENLPERQRHWVQTQLHLMDLYAPYDTDGRFGPMTRAALLNAQSLIAERTGGQMSFDLNNPIEAADFLNKMAFEQFMFIYDDGYEG